ncbi:conjugal transfer relaxase TraI [Yersinia aldovae]|uniref:LPD7 domain-containing protein n=1 Tax=Yersinia aldovae TaxID=29483 RepID=UPI0005E82985|nr:LPD7 domain-containing protein [Yersinia aldovae]CNK26222.1 conjugal transfer relaxase TraI [Yersinia aldovae]
MLARVSGGNSGIAEYLENGIKNGRDFTRDELDNRLVINGDLDLTKSTIDSIQDNGQDRYLHITLSFREDYVSEETLKAVTEEYKDLLMSAYKGDEYNFYAEAHLPKIKNIQDNKTGQMVSRKPHIHIVIPKTNLLTGNSLNPVGLYEKNIKYFEAIQEKINSKYNLESPKDFIRNTGNNHANVISRIKGDFYNEKQGAFKNDIIYKVESNAINNMEDFKYLVSQYGEVKVRNSGKSNEYIAVKIGDDAKFTNLNSPIFSKVFIESRQLPLNKPTDKQIETRVETWQQTASREIKFVASATPKFREIYRSSSNEERRNLLNQREESYERKHRNPIDKGSERRQKDNKRSSFDPARANFASNTVGLPSMPSRNVVYGVRGQYREAEEAQRILPDNEQHSVGNGRQEQSQHRELRRPEYPINGSTTGRIDTANVISQYYRAELEKANIEGDRRYFAQVRAKLEPSRLLNDLSHTHGLNPNDHKITYAKDGSARIGAGMLNLNVSDFLTKHMNMSWDEAKVILEKCYVEQLKETNSSPKINIEVSDWSKYKKEFRDEFNKDVKSIRSELNNTIRELKSDSFNKFQQDRSRIYNSIREPSNRKAALSIAIVERLKREELIREYKEEVRNTISAINRRPINEKFVDHLHNRGSEMGIADSVKKYAAAVREEDGLVKADIKIGVKPNLERLEKEAEANKANAEKLRMNDLIVSKSKKGMVEYKSQKDGSTVFEDRGDRIVFNKNSQEKEKIALGIELAIAKYGSELKLTGSEKFKQQVVEVAAEKNIKILLKPEKYQEMLVQMKADLAKEAEKDNSENSVVPEELAIAKGNKAEQHPAASSEETTPTSAENESIEAEPDLEQELFLRDEERELAYEELKQTIAKEMYGQHDSPLTVQQIARVENEAQEIWDARYPNGFYDENEPAPTLNDKESEDAPPAHDREVMVVEYSYSGEGNKFVMSIDGKPAADVLKERPEILDTLSKNAYLKQFTREELASGVIDETNKGVARDDVIDVNGNSVKEVIKDKDTQSHEQKAKDKGMEM